jgi:hypothetical protein
MVTTKWFRDNTSNVDKTREAMKDRPVVINREEFEDEDEDNKKVTYYCNNCRRNLIRLKDNDYYCNNCHTSVYPETDFKKPQKSLKLKAEKDIEDKETLISIPPEDDRYITGNKKRPNFKSGLIVSKKGP